MGKWIVCAAWPYVNTVPHLGTFMHLLSADVFARYLRMKGEEVVSVTGSDEHGTPIEVEAIKSGIPPKELTDHYHRMICDLLEKYEIAFDNYTRTESPVHVKFVQEFYKKVYDNGYVFTRTVSLPYCQNDRVYLPDRFVEGICPHCGAENAKGDQCDACGRIIDPLELGAPHCVFCGTAPTIKPSTHWFFDLPRFADRLTDYIESNRQLPENARNFSKRWIQEGLKPRALTRDNKWGIPAPFPQAEGKTIYVWLEAVLGYISATIEWAERQGKPDEWRKFWFDKGTKNVHFIGKDNIPFHTIIFPALLMAADEGYVLPWQVASTEFILYEGQKFSKSRRLGVWMDEALEIAPAEYWRFILIALRPEARDANFTWKEFESRINADLNYVLGNFIHRTLSFVQASFGGRVPTPAAYQDLDRRILERLTAAPTRVGGLIEEFRLREALAEAIGLARLGNQYLSEREPWHLIKAQPDLAATTVYLCVQLVHGLAILLAPFMPSTAQKIWRQLNLEGSVHLQDWGRAGQLGVPAGHAIGEPEPLFSRVEASEILRARAR